MERLFLDANVLFTAAISPDGASRALFTLAGSGMCALLGSRFAVDEAQRNVALKRPASSGDLAVLIVQILLVPEAEAGIVSWAGTLVPPKDAPILAAAVQCSADVLVTGDRRHFESLFGRELEGVVVLTPRSALERLLAG